jgi:hypothetical protein
MPVSSKETNKVEILPAYNADKFGDASGDLCTVLHGYGRVSPQERHYIDDYLFVGGVGRNIPRSVAIQWKKGVDRNGKPSASRVFPQAILGVDATEVDFAAATGINPMPAGELAAMISATNASDLVAALGIAKATQLAEELLKNRG